MSLIRLVGVSKTYPSGVAAVRDVSFTVPRGQTLCLIGGSGCGKTTTLKMINRLVEPTDGSIAVDDQDVLALDLIALRRRIGYVIQKVGLLPHRTVAENVGLLPQLEGWPAHKVKQRVDELLAMVGLDPDTYGDRYPTALSGGQQQRVGVARALALDPAIVLMDEPFGALDPITREQIQDEFLQWVRAVDRTIVLVTHDLNEAFKLGDQVALMQEGRILQVGAQSDFRAHPATPYVEEFVRRHLARPSLEELPATSALDPAARSRQGDPVLDGAATLKQALDLFLHHPETQVLALVARDGRSLGAITRDSVLQAV